jgi:hypothetical protein
MMAIVILAATLCSSDTVAPLTFIDSHSHNMLFSVIFGEGVLNDVVSVLLVSAAASIPSGDLNYGNLFLRMG